MYPYILNITVQISRENCVVWHFGSIYIQILWVNKERKQKATTATLKLSKLFVLDDIPYFVM